MASASRRKAATVTQLLQSAPTSFTLGQALRLLGMAHTGNHAEWQRFMHQHVRIRPWLSLAFPAAEMTEVLFLPADMADADTCGNANAASNTKVDCRITGTAFGLYSTLGPLPTFYTEELLEEARQDESVTRDFLDILNNRLHQLYFQALLHHKLFRCAAELQSPQTRHMLHCLMGQAYSPLQPQGPPQAALLPLLLRHTRSAMGLEDYLAHCLGLFQTSATIEVEQCVPRMATIPIAQRCKLGMANATLGDNSVLGSRIADSTGKFRIHIHQMDESQINRFLPHSPDYSNVGVHVRRFLDVPLEFDVCLHPLPKPVPTRGLGKGLRLGQFLLAKNTVPSTPVTIYHSSHCEI